MRGVEKENQETFGEFGFALTGGTVRPSNTLASALTERVGAGEAAVAEGAKTAPSPELQARLEAKLREARTTRQEKREELDRLQSSLGTRGAGAEAIRRGVTREREERTDQDTFRAIGELREIAVKRESLRQKEMDDPRLKGTAERFEQEQLALLEKGLSAAVRKRLGLGLESPKLSATDQKAADAATKDTKDATLVGEVLDRAGPKILRKALPHILKNETARSVLSAASTVAGVKSAMENPALRRIIIDGILNALIGE